MKTSSRVFALAMVLLLALVVCCPAASASADSLLSAYQDQITDAIGAIHENLGSLEEDLAAIRDEIRERAEDLDLSSGGGLVGDFLNGNTIEHNWQVIVDNSHFNDNTWQGKTQGQTSGSPTGMTSTAPKTGDLNNLVLWIAIVGASALALAVTAFLLLRRRNKKRKNR